MLIIGWQYSLLMQIPDALAWRNPEARYPGNLAFILNATQPLIATVVVAVMLLKLDVSLVRLLPAFVLGVVYAVYVANKAYGMSFDLTPIPECTNLYYPWWDNRTSLLLYFATTLAATAATPSVTYLVLSLVLFCGTVLISKQILVEACNSESLWCWSVAGAGLVTGCFALLNGARQKLKSVYGRSFLLHGRRDGLRCHHGGLWCHHVRGRRHVHRGGILIPHGHDK